MIRLTIPSIEEDDLQAVREALVSGYLVQGERVAAFEQAVADYIDSNYAVAVSSCTAALHIALLALDVRPRDIVLVTAYSWIATANVIELCGAKPAFVDICPDTFNMDTNCLEKELRQLMADTETAGRVVDRAIQMFGGMGVAQEMPLERWYRELRVKRIGEGPSEVHRMVIARDKLRNTDGGIYFG